MNKAGMLFFCGAGQIAAACGLSLLAAAFFATAACFSVFHLADAIREKK